MNFVDEQDVVRLQIGQNRRQIPRPLQHRAGGLPQIHAQFMRDDMRQGGFAQSRRAKQQHVIKGFTASSCRFDKDFQLTADFLLADVISQFLRTQRPLQRLFLGRGLDGGNQSVGFNRHENNVKMPPNGPLSLM